MDDDAILATKAELAAAFELWHRRATERPDDFEDITEVDSATYGATVVDAFVDYLAEVRSRANHPTSRPPAAA